MVSHQPRVSKEEITRIFHSFQGKNVLVIGDVMLDAYWWGKVERISPEAPVPIVHVQKREYRLGGAANVALNLKRLGAEPVLCSLIGHDADGDQFLKLLDAEGINNDGLIYSKVRPTTVKTRIISGKNQLLRVDTEEDGHITEEETASLIGQINYLLEKADLVIFEDYDKGVITPALIEAIIEQANIKNIPIAVDPKKRNFMAYKGVTLFKPNIRELAEGLKMDIDSNASMQVIENATLRLKDILNIQHALVTLSEKGVYISDTDGTGYHIPAHIRDIYDVSGAGDTVISVAALSLLAGIPIDVVAALANLAGGLVCENVGVVPIDKEKLEAEALAVLGDV
jgi:D-glycero-beta-D-manno-heptose-7-phosphate kinase